MKEALGLGLWLTLHGHCHRLRQILDQTDTPAAGELDMHNLLLDVVAGTTPKFCDLARHVHAAIGLYSPLDVVTYLFDYP